MKIWPKADNLVGGLATLKENQKCGTCGTCGTREISMAISQEVEQMSVKCVKSPNTTPFIGLVRHFGKSKFDITSACSEDPWSIFLSGLPVKLTVCPGLLATNVVNGRDEIGLDHVEFEIFLLAPFLEELP